MTPEVAKRLAEITVDPKTVVLVASRSRPRAWACRRSPFPLSAGTASYQGKIEVGGQTIPLSITQTIEEQGANWVVTGTAKMPMGDAIDVTTLDKATLVPRKRVGQAGAGGDRARLRGRQGHRHRSRWAATPSRCRSTSAASSSPTASARTEALAALPLAEGFGATFRNFDVRQQKVQLKQAKVTGAEERHGARRDLPGVEGRGHLGRGRARPDDDLDRARTRARS